MKLKELDALYDYKGIRHHPNVVSLDLEFRRGYHGKEASTERESHPYRGRGPQWLRNSCAFDCVTVAARLMNVGRTVQDIDPWDRARIRDYLRWTNESLNRDQQETLRFLIVLDWNAMGKDQTLRHRDMFLDHILSLRYKEQKAIADRFGTTQPTKQQRGKFLPVVGLFETVVSLSHRFKIRSGTVTFCNGCRDSKAEMPNAASPSEMILIQNGPSTATNPGPDMESLLNTYFSTRWLKKSHPNPGCPEDKSMQRQQWVEGDLPARLVAQVSGGQSGNVDRNIRGATVNELTINYTSIVSDYAANQNRVVERKASYRWLGGIYLSNAHFRLYWRDLGGGSKPDQLLVYDGQRTQGALVGGVPREEYTAPILSKPSAIP